MKFDEIIRMKTLKCVLGQRQKQEIQNFKPIHIDRYKTNYF